MNTTDRHGLTPVVMLATSMHSQPGVYAALLGSGVSTAAGIPTGWGVVRELVGRVAAAADPEDDQAFQRASQDPEEWWEANENSPLGYSSLLGSLAPTAAVRQAVLAGFFEQSEDDREHDRKSPTAAHRALARLVKRGLVRVILTTNFDRLMERALEAEGVSPQVVSSAAAVAGMTPLRHAKATVIKLHGDYADLGMLNTTEELSAYPEAFNDLLDEVFDSYGLIVAGWSGTWDHALRASVERSPSRRYPLYWDARSGTTEEARRLIALRDGRVAGLDAEDLFTGVEASIEALDRLAEPPLTTALAIARLKQYLPDPVRRIDLHELVMGITDRAVEAAERQPVSIDGLDGERLEAVYANLLSSVRPVLDLLVVGVQHDAGSVHEDLWCRVEQRLLAIRGPVSGPYNESIVTARHYPALLAMYTMGVAGMIHDREQLLIRLAQGTWWRDPFNKHVTMPVAQVLHTWRIIQGANAFPRWGTTRWIYSQSHLLRADLRDVLRPLLPSDDDYTSALDGLEYRIGLIQESQQNTPAAYRAAPGEFIGEWRWMSGDEPRAEVEFRHEASSASEDWPWWAFVGGPEGLDDHLVAYREVLKQSRRFG